MAKYVRPKALKKGDVIGFVAPARPVEPSKLERAVRFVEGFGFKVKVGRSCYLRHGYLAGEDGVRASDLMNMFVDPEVSAVFAVRGGYGSLRLLNLLDYGLISKNPKVLLGYSDITALHIALNQKAGLITFHGPMPTVEFISEELDEVTKEYLIKALTTSEPLGEIAGEEMLVKGFAEGEVVGGNLSLIVSTLGTPYEIDTKGKILVLEEVNEKPYRVDRMLTQLRLSGKLDQAAGIVLGHFTNCETDNPEESLTLNQVFEEVLKPLNKPILKGVKFGHGKPNITIPLGVKASIDPKEVALIIEESATEP
ncbi:MAG: LD-carboxypeptidase [Zestosphaera tikiterensis]|uniref:LD-carboxypeptidase n=1 Tax=Zestosphaera tikiterensis TaxID=1973259 RepID=A0A2R7Y398_9CREN|nr:MAG: LD-carboxypeptidase [Zestosphaera tikiterensis]